MSLAKQLFKGNNRKSSDGGNNKEKKTDVTLTLTVATDEEDEGEEEEGGDDHRQRQDKDESNRFLSPLPPPRSDLRKGTSETSSRSSFRQKFSDAGSFLSLYISSPSKLLKNSMLLAALSAFLMALYGMLYGIIKDDIARATVTVTRGLLQVILNLLISWYMNEEFKVQKKDEVEHSLPVLWTHFAMVVVFGGLRLCLIFAALQLTEMAIVHTILNGSPVMVMLLAHFILSGGERMNWIKFFSAGLLIIGIVMNSNPFEAVQDAVGERNFESSIGILLAMLALAFSSLGSIYTKKISRYFSKLHISAAIGASITVFGLISVLFDDLFSAMKVMKMNHKYLEQTGVNASEELAPLLSDLPPLTDFSCLFSSDDLDLFANNTWVQEHLDSCRVDTAPYFPADANVWTTAVVVGLLGIGQQYCLIAAIKMGSPSRVSMMRSSSIIFSFVMQSSHSVVPDWNQWVGAAIILGAIFINVLESSVKKKLVELRGRLCTSSPEEDCEEAKDSGIVVVAVNLKDKSAEMN